MQSFTPASALAGGALIGVSAALFLLLNGRVAGISGIVGGLLASKRDGAGWRLAFLAGLLLAPAAFVLAGGALPPVHLDASLGPVIVGGLLVGFGSRLGGGCTSGHGVCGIGRGSARSLLATGVFMATAIATVFVTRHLMGS